MKALLIMYEIVLCVLLFWGTVQGHEVRPLDVVNRTEILQKVFQDFLHIYPHTNRRKATMTPSPYMMDVISQYINKRDFSEGKIVRGIHPMKGKIRGEEMLIYNMTGVERSEDIQKAEFHIHKKSSKFWSKYKDGTLRISLFYISLANISSLTRIIVPITGPLGWQAFDITSAVRDCRNTTDINHLLGMKIEYFYKRKGYRSLPVKHFFKAETQPFILVFAQDEIEDIGSATNSRVISNRRKRSIHDNRISEVDWQEQSQKSVSNSQTSSSYLYTPYYTPQTYTANIDPDMIPYPTDLVPRKKVRKHKPQKKNKKRKNRKLPTSWNFSRKSPYDNYASKQNEYEHEDIRQCRRRRLTVDFNEIGWGDWIIAPKTFEAHYCAGTCLAPLSKTLEPSNHATIQSLVHTFGIDPDVPTPCCVPNEMSSLTLIYFDEDLNVVMKNYPNMSVESCSCR